MQGLCGQESATRYDFHGFENDAMLKLDVGGGFC